MEKRRAALGLDIVGSHDVVRRGPSDADSRQVERVAVGMARRHGRERSEGSVVGEGGAVVVADADAAGAAACGDGGGEGRFRGREQQQMGELVGVARLLFFCSLEEDSFGSADFGEARMASGRGRGEGTDVSRLLRPASSLGSPEGLRPSETREG